MTCVSKATAVEANFQPFVGYFITVKELKAPSQLTLMRSKSGQRCRQRSEFSGGRSDVRGYWLSLWHDTKQKHIDSLLQELAMRQERRWMDGWIREEIQKWIIELYPCVTYEHLLRVAWSGILEIYFAICCFAIFSYLKKGKILNVDAVPRWVCITVGNRESSWL